MQLAGYVLPVLSAWSQDGDSPLKDRATAFLRLHDGQPQAKVAKEAGIPVRTLARWVANYRRYGLPGLVDIGARGPRMPTAKQQAVVRFLVRYRAAILGGHHPRESIDAAAKRLGRSVDTIRRLSRQTGIPLRNDHQARRYAWIEEEEGRHGLVGLFVIPDLIVAVYQGEKPWARQLPVVGHWIAPGKLVRAIFQENGIAADQPVPLAWAIEATARFRDERISRRRVEETYRQWINMLVRSEPALANSLRVICAGNANEPIVAKLLRLGIPPQLEGRQEVRTPVSIHLNVDPGSIETLPMSVDMKQALLDMVRYRLDGQAFFCWHRQPA